MCAETRIRKRTYKQGYLHKENDQADRSIRLTDVSRYDHKCCECLSIATCDSESSRNNQLANSSLSMFSQYVEKGLRTSGNSRDHTSNKLP